MRDNECQNFCFGGHQPHMVLEHLLRAWILKSKMLEKFHSRSLGEFCFLSWNCKWQLNNHNTFSFSSQNSNI